MGKWEQHSLHTRHQTTPAGPLRISICLPATAFAEYKLTSCCLYSSSCHARKAMPSISHRMLSIPFHFTFPCIYSCCRKEESGPMNYSPPQYLYWREVYDWNYVEFLFCLRDLWFCCYNENCTLLYRVWNC